MPISPTPPDTPNSDSNYQDTDFSSTAKVNLDGSFQNHTSMTLRSNKIAAHSFSSKDVGKIGTAIFPNHLGKFNTPATAWKRVPKANSVCSSYSNSSFSDASTYTTISNRSIGKNQVSPGMTPTVPKLVKITKPLGIGPDSLRSVRSSFKPVQDEKIKHSQSPLMTSHGKKRKNNLETDTPVDNSKKVRKRPKMKLHKMIRKQEKLDAKRACLGKRNSSEQTQTQTVDSKETVIDCESICGDENQPPPNKRFHAKNNDFEEAKKIDVKNWALQLTCKLATNPAPSKSDENMTKMSMFTSSQQDIHYNLRSLRHRDPRSSKNAENSTDSEGDENPTVHLTTHPDYQIITRSQAALHGLNDSSASSASETEDENEIDRSKQFGEIDIAQMERD